MDFCWSCDMRGEKDRRIEKIGGGEFHPTSVSVFPINLAALLMLAQSYFQLFDRPPPMHARP